MNKSNLFFIFLSITFKLSLAQTPQQLNYWIIWNVGQGQWVTHVLTEDCLHYDMGGEPGSFKRLKNNFITACGAKKNHILLSHWDYDHYLNIFSVAQVALSLCWLKSPPQRKMNKSIQLILDLKLPQCKKLSAEFSIKSWQPDDVRSSNDSSIIHYDHTFLMPGDSPIQQENKWSLEMPIIKNTRVLILGHHGSRTSTGDNLLKKLPLLMMAVASARINRYGHPHKSTLTRLQKRKTPVLRTEDWGTILFL